MKKLFRFETELLVLALINAQCVTGMMNGARTSRDKSSQRAINKAVDDGCQTRFCFFLNALLFNDVIARVNDIFVLNHISEHEKQ